MNKFIILLVIITSILIYLLFGNRIEKFSSEPCADKLSNIDYLNHMIPHHQVAIDVSLMLQKKSQSVTMQNILRKIIWVQQYEISLMKTAMDSIQFMNVSNETINMNREYKSTVGNHIEPNKLELTNTYCDPHFFNPDKHMEHIKHMNMDDEMYINHMIPHHQVAVDMSKKILKHTKNDFMIQLAYRIINSQQAEIVLLNDLLKKGSCLYKSYMIK
jgi:uncharacterized protein (DUF305 family)